MEIDGIQLERRTIRGFPFGLSKQEIERYKVHDALYCDEEGFWTLCGAPLSEDWEDWEEGAPVTCKTCLKVTPKTIERRAKEIIKYLVG